MRKTVALIVCALLLGSMATAATKVTSTFSMNLMMFGDQSPQPETTIVWIDGNKMAMSYEDMTFLMDMESMNAYMINPDSQKYMTIPLHMDSLLGLVTEQYPQADSIQKFAMSLLRCVVGQFDVTIDKPGEMRQIGQFNTQHIVMNVSVPVLHVTYDMWVDTTLYNYWDLYAEMTRVMFRDSPEINALVEKTAEIKGLPVEYTMTIDLVGMPMSMEGEVIGYEEMTAPEGMFEIPASYEEIRFKDQWQEDVMGPDDDEEHESEEGY